MWGSMGAKGMKTGEFPNVHTDVTCGIFSVTKCGFVSFTGVKDLDPEYRKLVKKKNGEKS